LVDLGGNFTTSKSYVEGHLTKLTGNTSYRDADIRETYSGTCLVAPVSTSNVQALFPPGLASSDAQLWKDGATAIARCEPTNSVGNAATFLGELLKDGLPALAGATVWKNRTDAARNSGEEYLNYQFGWRPLVEDVKNVGRAVIHARSILEQYERDAGKVVRRRYNFPIERSQTPIVRDNTPAIPLRVPINDRFFTGTVGAWSGVREIERSKWFSGAFTYYLPTGYDSRSMMDRYALEAEKLFGLSLTPDTLWQLAPWSWAADWFANTGDVLHNLSAYANQGLILRYGYIMEHTIVRDTYSCGNIAGGNFSGRPIAPLSFVTETKIRRQASPFGFGVSWGALSAFQTSILAALGITRRGR
jgi:hypothetical protein